MLKLTGVKEAHSGDYRCQVENLFGEAVSEPARLCVGECIFIHCSVVYILAWQSPCYTPGRGKIVPHKLHSW